MIIVTHDMRLAADVSDHVVFLHMGRIEEEGPPDQLFGAPKSRAPAAIPLAQPLGRAGNTPTHRKTTTQKGPPGRPTRMKT